MAEYIERKRLLRKFNVDDMMNVNGTLISLRDAREVISSFPAADVAPVRHGRCPVCSGQEVLAQDCDNGYSVEIDAESQEMTLWNGDTCLAAISVDYCPVCGAKMDGAELSTERRK